MSKIEQILLTTTLALLCLSVFLMAASPPEWIQYNERVVGENSPLGYTDVANRPGKQIWGNFTSQHFSTSPFYPKIFTIYNEDAEPDIPNDTAAFWNDTYNNQWWLIWDDDGTQHKVELT